MKHQLLVITGKDRPGIIHAATRILYRAGANLEDIRMSILEGQFAMMLIAAMTPAKRRGVLGALCRLAKSWKLTVFDCGLPGHLRLSQPRSNLNTYLVRVIGRDKTGIVYHVSRLLARRKLNIQSLESRLIGSGKSRIYTMLLEFCAPKHFKLQPLHGAMLRLGKKLKVEIHISSAATQLL